MHIAQELIPHMSESPQPVALGLGRVVRAQATAERLEACVKAAEVMTRYLAVAGLASAASTRDVAQPPLAVPDFSGNLSFGSFEKAARKCASVAWDHPVREALRGALRGSRRHPAVAGQRLERFVRIRNELGHSITHMDEGRARTTFENEDPVGALLDMLDGFAGILGCPLLVVLNQEHRRGRLHAQASFFAGEGMPIPQRIELRDPVFEWEVPYLCTVSGLVPMSPGLVYRPSPSDGALGLFLVDGICASGLRYKSVLDNAELLVPEVLEEMRGWLDLTEDGVRHHPKLLESVSCPDGRTLYAFLSGAELPVEPPTAREGESPSDSIAVQGSEFDSLRSFEEHASVAGLGALYRDVTFAAMQGGARLELSGSSVRVLTKDQPERVLLTIEFAAGPALSVRVFGAGSGEADGGEHFELSRGEAADKLVAKLNEVVAIEATRQSGV
jgi:hypothetical protein